VSIIVSNLSKNYGSQIAVNNISFKINKNEIVGFLGPNGAGKSTTMKMITGYLSADAGQISVCDIQVSNSNLETKKKIGYLPESNPLYLDLYVKEYLQYIAGVHKIIQSNSRIKEVIELVGLGAESHKKVGQLSKGYKQRVGLAAALIHNPEVIILDEPTTGLDPNQIIEIREVIKKLGAHKTVLFSSHIMQEVEAICDRVIIINKGTIVADSKISELQKSNNSNHHFVTVVFKESIEISILSNISHSEKVDAIASNSLKITTFNPEIVRRQLLELSLQHNLNIISLSSEHQNLESIFKSLTT
jgi:ABC-2 type transport system ATP-binding protein